MTESLIFCQAMSFAQRPRPMKRFRLLKRGVWPGGCLSRSGAEVNRCKNAAQRLLHARRCVEEDV